MMDETHWLAKSSKKAKADHAEWALKQELKEKGIAKAPWEVVENPADLEHLEIWQRTSTTAKALNVSPTGSAELAICPFLDDQIPRVSNWKLLIRKLSRGEHPFTSSLLRDILFWHHQSKTGRWNDELMRFERWGVRSVAEWCQPGAATAETPSARTFHRIRNSLVARNLIIAEAHLFCGSKYLWIKPTDVLSRIVFVEGFWEETGKNYLLPKEKKKPRGLSKKVAEIKAEQELLYYKVIHYELSGLPEAERWKIYETLTKPKKLSEAYTVCPFASPGSYRQKELWKVLCAGC